MFDDLDIVCNVFNCVFFFYGVECFLFLLVCIEVCVCLVDFSVLFGDFDEVLVSYFEVFEDELVGVFIVNVCIGFVYVFLCCGEWVFVV